MRFALVLFILSVAASAEARSLQLVGGNSPAQPAFSARLLQASAPDASLPPPPLLPAPGGRVVPERRSPLNAPMQLDPHAGGISGKEILASALAVLGADVLSLGIGIGTGIMVGMAANDGWSALILGVLAAGLADFVLTPFAAALGTYLSGDSRVAGGGFTGAMLGSWAAQLASVAIYLGLSLIVSAASSQPGLNAGAVNMVGILGLAMHYVGLPMGASFGFHWRSAQRDSYQVDAGEERRPERLVVRPSDEPVAHTPRGVQLVAFNF